MIAIHIGKLTPILNGAIGGCRVVGSAFFVTFLASSAIAQDSVYGPPAPLESTTDSVRSFTPPPAIPEQLGESANRAVRSYPAIQAAEATILATDADVRAAKWLRFPSVSVGGRIDDDNLGGISPQISVQQPLWAGGSITASINRAEAGRLVADARLAETIQDLSFQTLNAYYEVVRAVKRESILQDSLAEHERLVESMARRVEQEVSPRSDLELATSRAAQVEQQLSLTTALRYTNLQRLAELTGKPDFELAAVPVYSPAVHHPSTDAAVAQALACDPTRRRLSAESAIAEAEKDIAQASIFPRIGLELSNDDVYGTRFGLVVSAQTNGGLSPFAAAQGARFRQDASILQLAVAERQLREQVILDVVENTTSAGTINSSAAAAGAAEKVTESFMRQFITGRRTWLDVMNAVREGMTAEMALVDAETTAMASAARLLLRTCEWRPDLMGPPNE